MIKATRECFGMWDLDILENLVPDDFRWTKLAVIIGTPDLL